MSIELDRARTALNIARVRLYDSSRDDLHSAVDDLSDAILRIIEHLEFNCDD